MSAGAIAQSWIGTPYVHQASAKGAGADCLGLVRGIWRELYGQEPVPVPAYSKDWAEPQGVEALWQAAGAHMIEKSVDDAIIGDVLLFRMRRGSIAKHMGIMTANAPDPYFVHSYVGHGVVQSALSLPWKRRLVAAFSLP